MGPTIVPTSVSDGLLNYVPVVSLSDAFIQVHPTRLGRIGMLTAARGRKRSKLGLLSAQGRAGLRRDISRELIATDKSLQNSMISQPSSMS